jgi:hypothetical protein
MLHLNSEDTIRMIQAILADDGIRARRKLKQLLLREVPEVADARECSTTLETIKLPRTSGPHFVIGPDNSSVSHKNKPRSHLRLYYRGVFPLRHEISFRDESVRPRVEDACKLDCTFSRCS